ncbi:VWA domain-containing protein [Kordiimonas sp.]|uniref:VWA domain-containing protein n=1 Tax=Kordiimonas sp. TaxID=1970157 RepID=UPI003A9073B8
MASKRRNRRNVAFNLAFLDVMSCGFGAAVLLFLIIKHGLAQNPSTDAEVARLMKDMADRQIEIASIEADIEALEDQSGENDAKLASVAGAISDAGAEADAVKLATVSLSGKIEEARKALSAAEVEVAQQEKDSRVAIAGQSSQQFLTGLAVKGRRIVIMVDHSASMLDEKILNIVRRRAMGGETASKAPKWVRTQRIAQWLVNKLPKGSQVRFVSFSETAEVIPEDRWLSATDLKAVTDALQKTTSMTPSGGTNLYHAFDSLNRLTPKADAVYLVTDGLPTMGRSKPRGTTVSGSKRVELFNEARRARQRLRARFNVILLPIEGDPDAAYLYWQLAADTGGRMLSPSEKWP